ncbi:MAG: DSBA-like protein thioredoxin domain-containing protein [Candidatus Roizmanbacteria bacterium GW2011_GWA2_36_23]|uniref:DSBA-like protein thioredoxin domain-containing protein n=1 Tax=Candidatus Roizmanbacteria bacterium GW2011_GWA2_36_23 TaxID=1618480 RepID=A0A0G0E5L0_9BACT|nr:MAG: DSBA-like protein thioredoxin domain-containing protein [Candidatus Roizmanbacteria bacterium GW2011_GWA2_36_23]
MKKLRPDLKPAVSSSLPEAFNPAKNSYNIVLALLVIVSLFSFYLFIKVRKMEKQLLSLLPQESQLSVNNLKKYTKELGINSSKFNKCLDLNEKKSLITSDTNYGSSLGVQGTPGFFINGKFFAGAFPFEFFKEVIDKEINKTGSADCKSYSEGLQKYCEVRQNKTFSDPSKGFDPQPQKIEFGSAPSTGAGNSKVAILEFSDFECPYCVRAYPTVKKILEAYPNDVRFYFKHYPLTQLGHKNAQKAAEAAACAQDQGKFWEFHDKLFTIQGS